MTVKAKTFGLLVLGAAVLTAAIALRSPPEPKYKNRPLSDWLDQYQANAFLLDSNQLAEAKLAISTIGTNALPYLVKWIQYEPPHWRNKFLRGLPALAVRRAEILTGRPRLARSATASQAITILGSNAVCAIPQLTTLMRDGSHPFIAKRALVTLSRLGAPALPEMLAAFENPSVPNRATIVTALAYVMAPEVGTNACFPALLKALQDNDPKVRAAASNAVSVLATDALTDTDPLRID